MTAHRAKEEASKVRSKSNALSTSKLSKSVPNQLLKNKTRNTQLSQTNSRVGFVFCQQPEQTDNTSISETQ